MKKLLTILFILGSLFAKSQVVAHAGGTYTIDRTDGKVQLSSAGSTGAITSRQWRYLTPDLNNPELCKIVHTTQATTWVHYLPYKSGGYKVELTVVGASNTSKDTATIITTWNNSPPQSTVGSYHVATSTDVLAINSFNAGECRVGDIIIDGADQDRFGNGSNNVDIYADLGAITFNGDERILIKGGQYGSIILDFTNATHFHQTFAHKIIVTNYGGQVEALQFSTRHLQKALITSRYVAGVSGDPGYIGDDGPFGFRNQTYGFNFNNRWSTLQGSIYACTGTQADSVEQCHFEVWNGGFAGVFMKQDNVDTSQFKTTYRGMMIHDIYVHDTGGEGIYTGGTGGDNPTNGQHLITGLQFFNNSFARTGNEVWQIGQQVFCQVHNNVGVGSGLRYGSAFQEFQDMAIQLDYRNGGSRFYNNLEIGSGEFPWNIFIQDKEYSTDNGDSTVIYNNASLGGHGYISGFLKDANSTIAQRLIFRNNYMGLFLPFKMAAIYSDPRGTNTQDNFRCNLGFAAHVSFKNNFTDSSKTNLLLNGTNMSFADSSGNTKTSTRIFPQFANAGFGIGAGDSLFYITAEVWIDSAFLTHGDEYPNLVIQGVRQGNPITYSAGAYVMWMGKVYKSRINSNQGNMPYEADSTSWQLQTWVNPNTGQTVTTPPDDFRLYQGEFYQAKGMGLTDVFIPGGGSGTPSIKWKGLKKFRIR